MAGAAGPLHDAPARTRRRDRGGEKAVVLLNRRAGRTSSPAGCAAAYGSARTVTSPWSSTRRPERWPAITAVTASARPACARLRFRVGCSPRGGHRAARARARGGVNPLPVFRLDSDVAAAAGVASVLSRFERAEAGVLVGTQMVAKGMTSRRDARVVLDADATLRSPTSGPRSAPSRWLPNWPGAAAAVHAAAG